MNKYSTAEMKKYSTAELEKNIKEWEKYNAIRDETMLEFAPVKHHLQKSSLSISQLTQILNIKPTTLLNWDIRIIKKFKIPEPKTKKWRRFSLLDLFGFKILRELKKRGVIIERTMNLFYYLKNDFCQFDAFVSWAKGNDTVIVYDYDKADIMRFSAKPFEALRQLMNIDITEKYYATIPFGNTIHDLLRNHEMQKLFNDTFRIRVMKDNKLAITINGKKSILKDMPSKPDKLTIRDGLLVHILD